jgi:YfiH family protein
MLQVNEHHSVTFFRAPILEKIKGVVHGFSTRGPVTGLPKQVAAEAFSEVLGLQEWPVVRLKQVHSSVAHRARRDAFGGETLEGDAAYTELKGIALEVRTADCLPVLIAERTGSLIAVAHAGWRGTYKGVVRNVLDSLKVEFGVGGPELVVAMGPHIGVCCLEVGEEVVERFADSGVFERRPSWIKAHLNLAEANRKQLLQAGVKPEMIQVSKLCTRCRGDLFHSYRRDGNESGRMFAVIGLRP